MFDCYLRARRGIMSFSAAGFQEALSHLERGRSALGENVLVLKGWARILDGKLRAALRDLRRAHQIDPGGADTMSWLGVGYLSTGHQRFRSCALTVVR